MRDKENDLEFERAHTIDVSREEYQRRLEEMNKVIDEKILEVLGHFVNAKVKFTSEEDEIEWMWVQIITINPDERTFVGRLLNTPLVVTHVDIEDNVKCLYDEILQLEIVD